MPGPSSCAITCRHLLLPLVRTLKMTSPRLAWSRMLRAISEMAAAISVISEAGKPSSIAISLPCWRAVTMSIVERISKRISTAGFCMVLGFGVEEGQAFLEVEGGADALKRQAELDHGEG